MKRYIRANFEPQDGYWYLSRHGVGPGCWPRGVQMLEYKEHPDNAYKCYVKLDRMLTTDELNTYDLKEEMPADVEGSSSTKYMANLVNAASTAEADAYEDDPQWDNADESEVNHDDLADIKNAVSNAVHDYMCGPQGGFDEVADPDDKYSMPWTDYAQIEVNDAGNNWIEVRVNAELSYEGFENMFELLNPVVERWDDEAYFDMEDSGRAVAMINMEA